MKKLTTRLTPSKGSIFTLTAALCLFSLTSVAFAGEINGADTAWMLVASALVMLMTPAGLALFYGGLTRRKSVLNTIGMAYTSYCIATIAWVAVGYSVAFGDDSNPYWGGLSKMFMNGVSIEDTVGTIPEFLFASFQGTFAAITVAIVSGAIIERVRYSTWLIFSFLWVIFCYAPIAHFVWGGGFLSNHGELDFAGGTVVHINAGVAGLILVLLIGKRRNFQPETTLPYSIKLTMLGAALLWFGWFGFNAGSALAADAIAASAFMVTNVAAATGGMAWLVTEWIRKKPRSLVGTGCGVVAGLVGITPASGFVDVGGAFIIGLLSGLVGYFAVTWIKEKLGYDDSLDAFGIHGIVGIFGALATGFLANPAINGAAGVFYGNPQQIVSQLLAVLATIIYCIIATTVIYKIVALITKGGRISTEYEQEGMDSAYHHERDSHSVEETTK